MARSRRKRPSIWPQLLLMGFMCLVAGAGLALFWPAGNGARAEAGMAVGPGPSAPREDAQPVEGLARAALEGEVRRLERVVAEKDAQITELTIQLKLAGQ
jgi:hypothetical protein